MKKHLKKKKKPVSDTTRIAKRLYNKTERFQIDRKFRDKAEDFQRDRVIRNGRKTLGKRNLTFTWQDVVEKHGWITRCYLTGREINLAEASTYQFDHVIPLAQNGASTIDNLGICCREANAAKHDMTLSEALNLFKEILEYHNYEVTKKDTYALIE